MAFLVVLTLLDTAGVHPEISMAIGIGLFRAEGYFLPASLVPTGASFYLLKADLFSPGMRKYGVGRDVSTDEVAKDKVAIEVAL